MTTHKKVATTRNLWIDAFIISLQSYGKVSVFLFRKDNFSNGIRKISIKKQQKGEKTGCLNYKL